MVRMKNMMSSSSEWRNSHLIFYMDAVAYEGIHLASESFKKRLDGTLQPN